MYADKITDSMQRTIDETNRRRTLQLAYNERNGITPQAIVKARNLVLSQDKHNNEIIEKYNQGKTKKTGYNKTLQEHCDAEFSTTVDIAADPVIKYMSAKDMQRAIERLRLDMVEAAKRMDFIEAAQLRDELLKMEEKLQSMEWQ